MAMLLFLPALCYGMSLEAGPPAVYEADQIRRHLPIQVGGAQAPPRPTLAGRSAAAGPALCTKASQPPPWQSLCAPAS